MNLKKEEITGIILAGGKSRRMGTDKAYLLYQGKMFIEHVILALEEVSSEILLIADDAKYDMFNKKRFSDILPDTGPLAALYTGLYHSNTTYNLVLGCDTPLVNKELFQLLLSHADDAHDIVQLSSRGQAMPLLALYKKSCMYHCLELLKNGERRLQESVETFKTKTIALDTALERYALNVNTQEDLNKIR